MSIQVKVTKKYDPNFYQQQLARNVNKFYADVALQMPYILVSTIQKGISPVEGVGRFQKYSQSYLDQIDGKVKFVYMNGHAVAVRPKLEVKRKNLYGAEFNKGAKKGQLFHNEYKKGTFSAISVKAEAFPKGLGVGKLKSPVNLTKTGVMLGTIRSTIKPEGVYLSFDSKIAKYHNDEGVGKAKTKRFMLPNKPGQTFSSLIMKKLRDMLKSALNN